MSATNAGLRHLNSCYDFIIMAPRSTNIKEIFALATLIGLDVLSSHQKNDSGGKCRPSKTSGSLNHIDYFV